MKKATLENIADGVAAELFSHELAKVMANIEDPNSSADAKRSITLTFEFSPDTDREEVKVLVSSKAKLTPVRSYGKTMYVGKQDGKTTLFGQDTKQTSIFSEGVTPMAQKSASTQ